MEKLALYLRTQNVTRQAFAAKIGIGVSTMTELLQGQYLPRADVAIRIEDATGGAVTVRDLV